MGVLESNLVGALLDCRVGWPEGDLDGLRDGEGDGELLGCRVGSLEGESDFTAVFADIMVKVVLLLIAGVSVLGGSVVVYAPLQGT